MYVPIYQADISNYLLHGDANQHLTCVKKSRSRQSKSLCSNRKQNTLISELLYFFSIGKIYSRGCCFSVTSLLNQHKNNLTVLIQKSLSQLIRAPILCCSVFGVSRMALLYIYRRECNYKSWGTSLFKYGGTHKVVVESVPPCRMITVLAACIRLEETSIKHALHLNVVH